MRNQDVLLPEVVNILVIHLLPRNNYNISALYQLAIIGRAVQQSYNSLHKFADN